MLSCNSTAIKDWSFFLSHILPLVNRSAGLVHRGVEEAEAVTMAVVTVALEPASSAPPDSNHTEHVYHQYSYSEGDVLVHRGREPPDREPIPLPKAVLYLLMAALVVVLVAYAIVGHLVKDLLHEFVEWVFGPRSANRRRKRDVSRVTAGGSEMSELPRLLDTNYITHNHTPHAKPEELVVNIEEPAHCPLAPHSTHGAHAHGTHGSAHGTHSGAHVTHGSTHSTRGGAHVTRSGGSRSVHHFDLIPHNKNGKRERRENSLGGNRV